MLLLLLEGGDLGVCACVAPLQASFTISCAKGGGCLWGMKPYARGVGGGGGGVCELRHWPGSMGAKVPGVGA